MPRARLLVAVVLLAARAQAKTYRPKTAVELEAALLTVRPSDSIKLEGGTSYRMTKTMNLSNVYQVKLEGGRGSSTIDGAGVTRLLQLYQAQEITVKDIVRAVERRRPPPSCRIAAHAETCDPC